jgi:hypothetical protein
VTCDGAAFGLAGESPLVSCAAAGAARRTRRRKRRVEVNIDLFEPDLYVLLVASCMFG